MTWGDDNSLGGVGGAATCAIRGAGATDGGTPQNREPEGGIKGDEVRGRGTTSGGPPISMRGVTAGGATGAGTGNEANASTMAAAAGGIEA